VAERCTALGFKDEGRVFESYSGHCVVFLGKTLLRFPLSPHVYKWVPDPVQDWGRQRQRERGDG